MPEYVTFFHTQKSLWAVALKGSEDMPIAFFYEKNIAEKFRSMLPLE